MQRRHVWYFFFLFSLVLLAGCSTVQQQGNAGGYYLNDGPLPNPPVNLDTLPNATPRPEALDVNANKPYWVMGHLYVPLTHLEPFHEKGIASWYGRRYQGKPTADGEKYNLWAMTAANPILPLPCYVRVTNLNNGKSVIVRVNDRGPFLSNRIMDLSYAAAYKLGYAQRGTALVSVHLIDNPGTFSEKPSITLQTSAPVNTELVAGSWYIQLGVFRSFSDAERFLVKAQKIGASDMTEQNGFYRVVGGPFLSRDAAQKASGDFGQALGVVPEIILAKP
ncbi:MAG TPA: septal ring lytic transglycosylase RlpA family protein [Burkholderiales bacterium]|nr:septal ring lytic transglycosylase RlpA family protein [Burkholderiales bacterium]